MAEKAASNDSASAYLVAEERSVDIVIGGCGAAGLLVANCEAAREGGTVIVNFYAAIVVLVPACAIGIVIGPLNFPATGMGWFGPLDTGAPCALFFAAIPPIGLLRATMITVVEPVFAILLAMVLFANVSLPFSGLALPSWLLDFSCLKLPSMRPIACAAYSVAARPSCVAARTRPLQRGVPHTTCCPSTLLAPPTRRG